MLYNSRLPSGYGAYSPTDEALLITCMSAKGLRVVSKSEFCADFKK